MRQHQLDSEARVHQLVQKKPYKLQFKKTQKILAFQVNIKSGKY